MVTTYILDPINIVYNYAIYSMYFETLLDNGPNLSYKLEFQTITYNRFPWLRVTVRKLMCPSRLTCKSLFFCFSELTR
jgi:hypothetical protein